MGVGVGNFGLLFVGERGFQLIRCVMVVFVDLLFFFGVEVILRLVFWMCVGF